ncbi:hypothetical protein K501DRAFT_329186 [Backusella circina FSU 941]|nr:hypothetical protein K501DRAFT_329186 [Backusella circina FSU 941]
MNSLPPEILHNIFIRLPLKQRLKCMFVCRQWCIILRRRSLLYNLDILHENQLYNLIDLIQRFPSRASQVEVLNIFCAFKNRFDNRKLCNLFPNLRVFTFGGTLFGASQRDFFEKPFELANPETKLEEIKDDDGCELTRQVITSGSCTRLRRLILKVIGIDDHRQNIFPYLKNMPLLKKLTLQYCDIGIQDCELMHSNLPAIQSIRLEDANLNVGPLPNKIIPATSVTNLNIEFDYITTMADYPNWYIYIARKYTNLEYFYCNDQILQEASPDQALTLYRDGLIPIYKQVGLGVNSFTAKNVPVEIDLFNQLDSFGCQISNYYIEYNETLPIFEQFGQSKQAKYVEQLEVNYSLVASPSVFQNMTSLTKLRIDVDLDEAFWPINLTEYLNAFPPSLTEFSACCTDLEISSVPTRLNNIESFYVSCSQLSEALGETISTCFPKLKDLDLRGRITENLTFDLPTHRLKNLRLETRWEEVPLWFSVKYAVNSHYKYFIGRQGQDRVEPATAEDHFNGINIAIKCAYVKGLYLNNAEFVDSE